MNDTPRFITPEGTYLPESGKNMILDIGHGAVLAAIGSIDSLCTEESVLTLTRALNQDPKGALQTFTPKELKAAKKKFIKKLDEIVTYLEAHQG